MAARLHQPGMEQMKTGRLFQSEGAGLLHGSQHLLIEHGEGLVRRQVQAVEAGVSSEGTKPRNLERCHHIIRHYPEL